MLLGKYLFYFFLTRLTRLFRKVRKDIATFLIEEINHETFAVLKNRII